MNEIVRTIYLYAYDGDMSLPLEEGDSCLEGQPSTPLESVPGVQPGLVRRLSHAMRDFDPDIVQVNGSRAVKYGAVAKWLRTRGERWRLVYRNIDMPSFWNRRRHTIAAYRRILMPSMDGVIAVSRASLEDVRRLYALQVPAVAIVNGIDIDKLGEAVPRDTFRLQHGVQCDETVLLFVASFVLQKRPDRFLRVVERLRRSNARVRAWLIGDGPLRHELERMARDMGIDDLCTFFGYRQDVGEILRAGDILVMTSDTEGIPAVILEAGYVGVPTVATSVGALHECVQHGETGLLVPEPYEENIAAALIDLMQDPGRRRLMAQRARELILERFTIGSVATRYLSFYESLSEMNTMLRTMGTP